jgi:hypothetical protein
MVFFSLWLYDEAGDNKKLNSLNSLKAAADPLQKQPRSPP